MLGHKFLRNVHQLCSQCKQNQKILFYFCKKKLLIMVTINLAIHSSTKEIPSLTL